MAVHMIGYDLHPSRGETYDELIEAIKRESNDWWHCLDSTWLIVSNGPAADIRNRLKQHLKYRDDELLVVRYGKGAAWAGFGEKCSDWLKDHL